MISQTQLDQIANKLNSSGVDETVITSLREEFNDVHFTYCSEDDIPNNEPVLEQGAFNLYLIDGREHCLCLTSDFENATGVVVAEIYQD